MATILIPKALSGFAVSYITSSQIIVPSVPDQFYEALDPAYQLEECVLRNKLRIDTSPCSDSNTVQHSVYWVKPSSGLFQKPNFKTEIWYISGASDLQLCYHCTLNSTWANSKYSHFFWRYHRTSGISLEFHTDYPSPLRLPQGA
jgi:hypothetical protein